MYRRARRTHKAVDSTVFQRFLRRSDASVTQLDLAHAGLSVRASRAIGATLPYLGLTALDLRDNYLVDESCAALCDGLRGSRAAASLARLNLRDNRLAAGKFFCAWIPYPFFSFCSVLFLEVTSLTQHFYFLLFCLQAACR